MIKAIDTIYNGYKFCSRLEARWAVYFDKVGIKYEYEKEGYDLDGIWYLPDFWLEDFRTMSYDGGKTWIKESAYVEIKAQLPTEAEIKKLHLLCEATGKNGYIFCDTPGAECWVVDVSNGVPPHEYWFFDDNMSPFSGNDNKSWFAAESARQSRFEHGKKGI